MSRTPMHAAHVTFDFDKKEFVIAKRIQGKDDYIMRTEHGYNCYMVAMDMARDNGSRVTITKNAALVMNAHACNVDHEWTIVD